VAFISSKISDQLEGSEFEIKPEEEEWQQTGLIVPSVLKLHKMVSLPQNLILRDLGYFPESKMETLEKGASVSITVGIGAFLFPTDKHRLKTQIFTEILPRFFICAHL